MGSDLHMNPPYEPPPKASVLVSRMEERIETLERQLGAVIAAKSKLEEQSRKDAQTIVRLIRERGTRSEDD